MANIVTQRTKSFLFCLVTGIFFSCQTTQKAQTTAPSAPATTAATTVKSYKKPPSLFKWDQALLDLGKITKGEIRNFTFEFTNASQEDIQIEIVSHCDCTEVDYPRGKFKPGEKGKLVCSFKSAEKDDSETIDIDLIMLNLDAEGSQRIERVSYKFELIK